RERIVFEDDIYKVLNTDIIWSESEILKHLNEKPERFSPNVIMRPLYQEVILPNLCYIGGGGELAYWIQLKSYFDAVDVTFPMLLLRNSVLIKTEKQTRKLNKLN
ncbi:bacillithiol biosynthesis BshC, partial [Oceanospirillum sp. D5]|nr:bacillithiol biosynthesis BshC [Oceanospirillum sediminis]